MTMIFKSVYRPLELPLHETVPSFVLRFTSDENDNKKILIPSVNTNRRRASALSLAQVRESAYGFGTALMSKDVVNRPWKKGEVMAFYSENQHDYLVAALGVMLAGGVPSLLSPMYKPEELNHAFELTHPRAILASVHTLSLIHI